MDARTSYIEEWYVGPLPQTADHGVRRPGLLLPPLRHALRRRGRNETARGIWKRINEPNLSENVLPTRGRAQLVLTKDADHSIRRMLLRKI